ALYAWDNHHWRRVNERQLAQQRELHAQQLAEERRRWADQLASARKIADEQLVELVEQRRLAREELDQLRRVHLSRYEAAVIAERWDGGSWVERTNVGAGPALNRTVRSVHSHGERLVYLCARVSGVPPGQSRTINLQ